MKSDIKIYDINNHKIQKIIKTFKYSKENNQKELAIEIYNFVRDNWYYSPTRLSLIEEEWHIDYLINKPKGHCIDKSIILITLLKAVNIPARLGLAKVKNHIAIEKVSLFLGSDVLVPHGYVEIFLNNKWVKATPAFNKSLCEKLNVAVLEFNGKDDSLFQPYSKKGNQFMEYLEDYGTFEEFPLDFIAKLLLDHYPILKKLGLKKGSYIDIEDFK